jgi:hypothetical protein
MVMRRRQVLALLAGGMVAGVGQPALAQSVGEQIADQLRRMGYREISVQRTLLGRVRVTGVRGGRLREVIVNPSTGEILRDLVTDTRTGRASSGILDDDNDNDSRRSGSSGSDDDNDDDDDDDGGSSSGSGGGGSDGSGSNSGSGSGSDDDDDDDDDSDDGGGGGGDDDDDDDDD